MLGHVSIPGEPDQPRPSHLTCAWGIRTPYSTIPGIRSQPLTTNEVIWQAECCCDVVSGIRCAVCFVALPHSEHHRMPTRRDIPLSSPSYVLALGLQISLVEIINCMIPLLR